MDELAQFIERLGLPVGLVVVALFAIWRIARFLAPLGQKVVVKHIEFLDATKTQQARTVDAIERQTELLSGISRTNKSSLDHLANAAKSALNNDTDAAKLSIDKMRDTLK
jgi:uncharacterized membrane-anchored protein YhcB (DUF1043 family)